MRGKHLASRILGIAATLRGFAYALTEGPGCLVDVSTRVPLREGQDPTAILVAVITRGRPLFVAFGATKSKRGTRESIIDDAVTDACDRAGVMVLRITAAQLDALASIPNSTAFDIANEIAHRFPEIAHRLPAKRKMWQAEDERLAMFRAAAAALAAWKMIEARPGSHS